MIEWWHIIVALMSFGLVVEITSLIVMVWAVRAVLWPRFKRWMRERGVE